MKFFQTKFWRALLCASLLALPASSVLAELTTSTVDSTGIVGSYTSLALNSSGFPVISYYDQTNGDLKLAVCSNVACTAKTITTVDGATADVGKYTSLALNSSGFPVISYYDQTNGNLKLAICSNATCTSKRAFIMDGGPEDRGLYTSLALKNGDIPVVSYYDQTNHYLVVAVCSNAACTSGLINFNVDYIGEVGQYTSLKLNSSGFPVISYYDQTNGNLKLSICSDIYCWSTNPTTVDSTGDVGQYTSLALKSGDIPVISYYDKTNGDLKLAICSDTDCSSVTLLTEDSYQDIGLYTSLALKSGDIPVISYYDQTNGYLKYVICSTAACTGNTTTGFLYDGTNAGQFTSLALKNGQYLVVSYYNVTNGDLVMYTDSPLYFKLFLPLLLR